MSNEIDDDEKDDRRHIKSAPDGWHRSANRRKNWLGERVDDLDKRIGRVRSHPRENDPYENNHHVDIEESDNKVRHRNI